MFLVLKKCQFNQYEVMTASTFPFYMGIAGIVISLLILVLSFKEKDNGEFISMELILKTLRF